MIVPSIDLMNGHAVQLVGGEELKIDAGDPFKIAERFARVGDIAVIDLDAAKGTGSNRDIIERLCERFPCRVGGGIRSVENASSWLDVGARKIIIGTRAEPEMLRRLPRERLIAALDARHGDVVVEGWATATGRGIVERMHELRAFVSGFLVTSVEREGRLAGADMQLAKQLKEQAGNTKLTLAGGVAGTSNIAELDALGIDAQVGMAIYDGSLPLHKAFLAPINTDRTDGLIPTVVADQQGVALGLVYSSHESVAASIDEGAGIYFSRSRGGLWRKGESSGSTQRLIRIDTDCDRDALRFTVEQRGTGFCHTGTDTCFGQYTGLSRLHKTLQQRLQDAPEGSYTCRLLDDPALLRSKLIEEAAELAESENASSAAWESADVLYFALVKAIAKGATLSDIERHLDRRSMRVSRRAGDAKTSKTGIDA